MSRPGRREFYDRSANPRGDRSKGKKKNNKNRCVFSAVVILGVRRRPGGHDIFHKTRMRRTFLCTYLRPFDFCARLHYQPALGGVWWLINYRVPRARGPSQHTYPDARDRCTRTGVKIKTGKIIVGYARRRYLSAFRRINNKHVSEI